MKKIILTITILLCCLTSLSAKPSRLDSIDEIDFAHYEIYLQNDGEFLGNYNDLSDNDLVSILLFLNEKNGYNEEYGMCYGDSIESMNALMGV